MKLQDYLHLYLGCYVAVKGERWVNNGFVGRLIGVTEDRALIEFMGDNWEKFEDFKPILRPLSDMTEEEFREIFNPIQPKDVADEDFKDAMQNLIENGIDAFDFDGMSAQTVFELTRKLLSKHFDLFGLIEAGLAIDKTKEAAL
jgi:hypothetical protein